MQYTVREITRTKEWEKDGKTIIYFDFKADGEPATINIGRKPGNELKVGEVLEGTLEPEDSYGVRKFVKAATFGGGGGSKRDPVEEAKTRRSIQGQVAAKLSVEVAQLAHASGRSTEQVMATVELNAKKLAALIEELAA